MLVSTKTLLDSGIYFGNWLRTTWNTEINIHFPRRGGPLLMLHVESYKARSLCGMSGTLSLGLLLSIRCVLRRKSILLKFFILPGAAHETAREGIDNSLRITLWRGSPRFGVPDIDKISNLALILHEPQHLSPNCESQPWWTSTTLLLGALGRLLLESTWESASVFE